MRMSAVVDHDWILSELRRSLRGLASDGPQALATVPDGCVKADELALDFANFLTAALGNFPSEFTPAQRTALESVNRRLGMMSGLGQPELWTDEAVRSHPVWSEVRVIAREAARLLGWAEAPGYGV